MKHLEYKGYTGTIEYSKEDELLFGKVIGIKGLLSYEGCDPSDALGYGKISVEFSGFFGFEVVE